MAVAFEPPDPNELRSAGDRGIRIARDPRAGAEALRHLAAEVSGQLDLATLFGEVVADGVRLFGLKRMGLWLYEADRRQPFTLAAQHGLSDEVLSWVSSLAADTPSAGVQALRSNCV